MALEVSVVEPARHVVWAWRSGALYFLMGWNPRFSSAVLDLLIAPISL